MASLKVNPAVERLQAYVPGEQPRGDGFIKLNTNESPFAPAPQVVEAVRAAAEAAQFQKYPDPVSRELREGIASDLKISHDQILIGNGSDEVLRLLCHAYLDPALPEKIGMLYPTYVLYRTLAEMFGATFLEYDVTPPAYDIPPEVLQADVRIFFLPNPNPPIGTRYMNRVLSQIAGARADRLLVIDEAYVDFAGSNALELLEEHPNVVITRTFSKSYSLAGLRVGFVVAQAEVIEQLDKIRDSYNVNRLSQAAALAAWKATEYYTECTEQIRANREFTRTELVHRGFEVPVSEGNFLFARRADAAELYAKLKEQKILVRYFNARALQDGIRVTIGTREHMEAFLRAIDDLAQKTH